MSTTGYVISAAVGGMIAGAVGASVAISADSHPVLKGALATGALNALIALAFMAGSDTHQISTGVSGQLSDPRFP